MGNRAVVGAIISGNVYRISKDEVRWRYENLMPGNQTVGLTDGSVYFTEDELDVAWLGWRQDRMALR